MSTMWNRRKDDEPVRPSSAPTPLNTPMEPPAAAPAPVAYAPTPRATAMIGENVFITGQIQSREDLIIDGQIDGTIEMLESKLTIGKNGRVKAMIRAREVVVQGHVHGNIEASEKIDLRREAHLVGDIRSARISIEDGAMVRGSVDMNKPEPPARPAAAPKKEAASAPAPASAQTAAASGGSAGPQQQPLPAEAKR